MNNKDEQEGRAALNAANAKEEKRAWVNSLFAEAKKYTIDLGTIFEKNEKRKSAKNALSILNDLFGNEGGAK